jgi:hypothetical protein
MTCIGEMRYEYKVLAGNPEQKISLKTTQKF